MVNSFYSIVSMENFHLTLYGSLLLFFLLLLISAGLSYFVYQHTNPPVPKWLNRTLTILRFSVLFFVLFILFERILKVTWHKREQPIIAVLLDNSASMALEHNGQSRAQKAISLLKSDLFSKSSSDNHFDYYSFSYQLNPLAISKLDSVKFVADGTDFSACLKQLREQNSDNYLKAVVILSDGINNLGENPLRAVEDWDVPLYPLAVGPVVDEKDVVLSKISTNQLTYTNNEVPVDVTIQAIGFNGRKIKVELLQENTVIDSKYVDLADNLEATVRLIFIPRESGLQKYQIRVPVLENELSPLNNQKSFYVKVLKSKIKILYFSGGAGADFSFIKRKLDADQNMETDYWVTKSNQSYYQGNFANDLSKLKNYDCIIFQNYPPTNFSSKEILSIKKLWQANPIPLLFIAGNNINYQALTEVNNFLPFLLPVREYPEFEISPHLTGKGAFHPITRIDDDEIKNQVAWQELPPIFYSLYQVQAHAGSEMLLEAEPVLSNLHLPQRPLPFVLTYKIANYKAIAILGYGLWRWDLLMWGIGKNDRVFTQLLNNSIRWLINKEDNKTVRIKSDEEVYRSGKKIIFSGQVYTENYLPLNGAEVKVNVFNHKNNYEIILAATGEGKYEGELMALEGGEYRYEGTARYKNLVLGADKGQFSVENFNIEHLQTKIDERFLRQLAQKSNGQFISDSTLPSLTNALKFPTRIKTEAREISLWNKLMLLIGIIILLTMEWFIRKRSGML